MHGLLILDKPAGLTSAAVVARVKRVTGARKIGHTGTLDPMATGVLPLCFGEATKLAGFLTADEKAYEGTLELGVETDTLDADGTVTREARELAAGVNRAALLAAMVALTGDIEQVPPMFSALKQDGRRLHELARAGQEVERAPRPVTVRAFELLSFEPPHARFRVECSKGTYVRCLVADVGRALGCGAHLTALRRTRSGVFQIADAISMEQVEADSGRVPLLSLARAVAHLPSLRVPDERLAEVRSGLQIAVDTLIGEPPIEGALVVLLDGEGALLALMRPRQGRICYERVFTNPLTPQQESSTLPAP